MNAEAFLKPQPILIFILGLVAFAFSTVGGGAHGQAHESVSEREDQPPDRFRPRFRRTHGGPGIPGRRPEGGQA